MSIGRRNAVMVKVTDGDTFIGTPHAEETMGHSIMEGKPQNIPSQFGHMD
jgi:hypothetical protein